MSSCPWKVMLPAVGADLLDDATFAAVDQHVEECPDCKSELEELALWWGECPLVLPGPGRWPRIPGFEIDRELGRGGMGVVYLAIRAGLKRPVAIKILPRAGGTEVLQQARRRCLREAEAISSIRHPGVVPLYDYGEADGWFFLVLEYIPGGSLKARRTGALPPREAARLVERIARAVAYIHARGLLHLDLKPSNILLDDEEGTSWDRVIPRVSDFGLAAFSDAEASATGLAGLRGTPSYMAPEQSGVPNLRVGPAADIYALGTILFELLTGRPPFQGASTFETIRQVRGESPLHPRTLSAAIPRDLEAICLKCLKKDPGRRYASAEAMAEDLARFLDGRPVSGRPVPPIERVGRWCRRRPTVASLIAALTLTLVGGSAGLFALWRLSEAERVKAEAARRLAEDNEKLASRALAELNDVLVFALTRPEILSEDRMRATVASLRKETSRLRDYRGVGPRSVAGLAIVERLLAARLRSHGNPGEARALLVDSVAVLKECCRLDPADEAILWQLAESLWLSGTLGAEQHRIEESMEFCEQAASLLKALRTEVYRTDLISRLYLMRRGLAEQLTRRGEAGRAWRTIEANRRMFDSMHELTADQRRWRASNELALADLTPGYPAIERVRALVRRCPDDLDLRKDLERRIDGWLTRNPFSPAADPSLLQASEGDPEAWAETLVWAIRSRCSGPDRDAAAVPAQGYRLAGFASIVAWEQRSTGRVEHAERTAGRLMALARRLVLDYPGQPESHLALSEAHHQVSKNAWQHLDYPSIERALRQALASVRHAANLDPQHEGARHLVDSILPKLALFDAGGTKPK